MPQPPTLHPWHPGLNSRDIIAYEHYLAGLLAEFVPFKNCRLHFPPSGTTARADWLPNERRLLIPLRGREDEGLLAVFSARQVPARAARSVLPFIEKIAGLCVEQVRLLKAAMTDPATGLANREYLIDALSETRHIRLRASCSAQRIG